VAIGNITIRRAGDHLSATSVRTLAPVLADMLERAGHAAPAAEPDGAARGGDAAYPRALGRGLPSHLGDWPTLR
jgi:hypothetical protein